MARILVVDDEPDVRELFNITLKMAGHTTETAKDGVEAVERLSKDDLPDLVLLDLMMPRLDGFGLLSHIREKMGTKPVRVLVATAKVLEDSDQQKLEPWPVVGVLNKGELDIAAMVTIVSNALGKEPLKPAAPEAPKPSEAPTTAPPQPQPAASQPAVPQPTPPATPASSPVTAPSPVRSVPAVTQSTSPAAAAPGSGGSQSTPPAVPATPAAPFDQPSVPITPPQSGNDDKSALVSQDTKAPVNSKPQTSEERKPEEAAPAAKETRSE